MMRTERCYGRPMGYARIFLVTFLVLAGASCSSPPANVAGSYSLSLADDQNGWILRIRPTSSATSSVRRK